MPQGALALYRRHLAECPHVSKGNRWTRCQCPIWVQGSIGGEAVRRSMNTANWTAASTSVHQWQSSGRIGVLKPELPSIAEAVAAFLKEAETRNLAATTIQKRRELLEGKLLPFCKGKGFRQLRDLTVDRLRAFRHGWTYSPLSAAKRLEYLRAFCRFCVDFGWIERNPASALKATKVSHRPTLPYSDEEVDRLLEAARKMQGFGRYGPRIEPMILLLRCSGLRMQDAACLERKRLADDKLFLYQQKTGTPVYCPVPPEVVEAVPILASPEWLDTASLRRFQWTGIVAEGKRCHTNKVPCHTDLEKRFSDFLDRAKDVVRYFKNERLGFSVTYYEGGRPRQYFPDFIIVAREPDGREVMWLAETKGEMRLNTPLKSDAAMAWCEKMSGTRYGQWRFLFVQQRKLERSLVAGVSSLAALAETLVQAPGEPQLKLLAFDDERARQEAFKKVLPLYSLKAAAGYFGRGESVEPEGWVEAEGLGPLSEQMFVCRAVGRSMEPAIRDGDFLVLRARPVGSRSGKTVLAQYRGPADPDTGGAFTIKKYSSVKEPFGDDSWRHTRVTLSPTNPEYQPIFLTGEDAASVSVIAELVTVLRG